MFFPSSPSLLFHTGGIGVLDRGPGAAGTRAPRREEYTSMRFRRGRGAPVRWRGRIERSPGRCTHAGFLAPSLRGPRVSRGSMPRQKFFEPRTTCPRRTRPERANGTGALPLLLGSNVTLLDSDRDFSHYTGFGALCGPECVCMCVRLACEGVRKA